MVKYPASTLNKHILLMLFLILLSVNISTAVTFSPNDIEWDTAVTGTLYRGGTLTNGNYTVRAVQFASAVPGVKVIKGDAVEIVPETDVDPSVLIEIYKDNVLVKDIVMTITSEAYIDPDYEVKVSTTEFTARNAKEWVYEYYNPSASVSIQLRAVPELEITVETDETAYTSYEDTIITATVTVKNTGKGFAKNVDVNLNTGGLKTRGGDARQLRQYYYKMEKETSQSFEVILVVPQLIDEKSYTLSADADFNDVKELEYKEAGSATIEVLPRQNFFTLSKSVSKDRIYLSDTIIVRITAATSGMFDVYNIHIKDSMSDNFKLGSNTTFNWTIPVLKPGGEWTATYSIKSIETNLDGFTLQAASADFSANNRNYTASSESPRVIVNGPKILLNKTVDSSRVNIGEYVTVSVIINNKGNIATRAEVMDTLPDGVSFVSGSTSLKELYLEINKPQNFTYTIRMDKDGNITLPAAVANYSDIKYKGAVRAVLSSERPTVTVIDPSKTPAPTPEIPADGPENQEHPTQTETALPEDESFVEKIFNKVKSWFSGSEGISNETNESSPNQVTPGFNVLYAVMAVVFYTVRRRK